MRSKKITDKSILERIQRNKTILLFTGGMVVLDARPDKDGDRHVSVYETTGASSHWCVIGGKDEMKAIREGMKKAHEYKKDTWRKDAVKRAIKDLLSYGL